jgi:hypothetical protein
MRIISADERGEVASDRWSYIILRGHWCDITALNDHDPTEDKTDDMKGRISEQYEHVFKNSYKFCLEISIC